MLEYETLKLVWWLLIGVLLLGFAITDGFDMGAVSLLKVIGTTDAERRVILNTVGPHWDGNQVWFITAGGAIFAAWPVVYAVAFSGLYWALLLVLFAMFFRPVGFEYRSKIEQTRWRNNWDWLLTIGSAVPALVFGVAFGNLFLGLPFTLDETMRSEYLGSFWQLLSPFALLCGLVSLSMLVMHGGCYLQMRTEAGLQQRAQVASFVAAAMTMLGFAIAGLWVAQLDGYHISQIANLSQAVTPFEKQVQLQPGGWLDNYQYYPLTTLAPILGFTGLMLTMLLSHLQRGGWAFVSSSIGIAGIICTAGFSLYPFVLPSSLNPNLSLTLWDSVSSQMTLGIMFWVAMIFVPIILCYTLWSYYKMWGRISEQHIKDNPYGTY